MANADFLPLVGSDQISLYDLAALARTTSNIADVLATHYIRDTLALYALALDGRNLDVLDRVFTPDVHATYMEPLGVLRSLSELKTGLSKVLSGFTSTQHNYGTQIINITSPDTAVSVTYIHASHFTNSEPATAGILSDTNVFYGFAQYQDSWVRQSDASWKITKRIAAMMVSLPAS